MDKGHLSLDKLVNSQLIVADDGNKDDVAIAKKEKSLLMPETNEAITPVISIVTNTPKNTSRGKEANDKKIDVKTIVELQCDTEELLGSVTTNNCHGTRTSARVIQKMRQDQQTRPVTPPPSEREAGRKEERSTTQKTPSQVRANRPTWSNVERNHFFDALNEFGKDFEAIGNFINSKLKRRSPTIDISFKSKDQVRQHYYQSYHKICKYIRFSEEVRKPVQELYALINYGEMRRKLQFVTDKHFMKLRNLIYHGHITVRCKGKNIRIKTPSCKALRRLNQLDDSLEDIRLPSKIEVIVSPTNMEAFGRVQTIAQNPRCRTTVPLHKKLINFVKTFEYKWRSMDVRVAEEAKLINSQEPVAIQAPPTSSTLTEPTIQDPEICFLPKPGVTIHRPLLSITEYLSSVNICLTAYEERIGVKVKGEFLNTERCTNNQPAVATTTTTTTQTSNTSANFSNKRLRTESGSEKRSPEQLKRLKNIENSFEAVEDAALSHNTELDISFHNTKNESSGDELSDEIQELLCDSMEINTSKEDFILQEKHPPPPADILVAAISSTLNVSTSEVTNSNLSNNNTGRSKRSINNTKTPSTRSGVFKPLLNDDIIQSIRSGWTASTAGDITIGDLYVVFGHDSKLELDYYWMPDTKSITKRSSTTSSASTSTSSASSIIKSESPASSQTPESAIIVKQNVTTTAGVQKQNINCSASSSNDCDERNLQNSLNSSSLSNKLKQLLLIANLSERMRKRQCNCNSNMAGKVKFERDRSFIAHKTYGNCGVSHNNDSNSIFRQPMLPVRRTSIDPVKQLTTLTRQKMSRQILVQRLLLPSNGSVNSSASSLNPNSNQAITPDTTTSITNNMSPPPVTSKSQEEVPWLQDKKYSRYTKTQTAISTNNSPLSNHHNPPNSETSNTTFLNSINVKEFEEHPLNMEPQTSHYQQQQQQQLYQDIMEQTHDKTDGPSSVLSADSAFDECSNTSFLNGVTPMNLLRETTSSNSRWLEDNINDFSLTSLLGHLDEINSSRDILDPSSNLSVISESSVDYMHKFQEIKALLQSQEKD